MASLVAHETDLISPSVWPSFQNSRNNVTGLLLGPLSLTPVKLVSGLSLVTALCPLKAEPTFTWVAES